MLVQKFFHLDCNSVIPECGHRCARCIEEIRSVLERSILRRARGDFWNCREI